MKQYERFWIEAPVIQPQDLGKVCKQVYVWIVTKDKQVVIVSKDRLQWQLPGGKPEAGETLAKTAIREVREETSLDISELSDDLRFFGYHTVTETGSEEPPYLQVRYLLELDTEAAVLELGAQNENNQQPEKDVIKFADVVSLDELEERISWVKDSPEFITVKSLVAA